MAITRRTVLKFGIGGALLLAAAGTGLGLRSTVMRVPPRMLQVLDARSYSILAAIADRIAPGGEGFPTATALGIPEKIDALLASLEPEAAAEVVQLLYLFDSALPGFLFDQRFQTFTSSPPDVQDQVIDAWRSSRLAFRRTVYKALQGLISSAYYSTPEVYPLMGYPGPPNFGNVRPKGTLNPANPAAPVMIPGSPMTLLKGAVPVAPSGELPVAPSIAPSIDNTPAIPEVKP